MKKYLDAIERRLPKDMLFCGATIIGLTILATLIGVVLAVLTIQTNGLTLVPVLIWWIYIVYKEANKQ